MPAIPLIAAGVAAAGSAYAANKQNQAGKNATSAQQAQNASDRQFQIEMANQAKNDVTGIYQPMQSNAALAGQAALTTMKNALPQSASIRQQGTQNAIAALLGGQGKSISPNFGFIPQNIPNYQTYNASNAVSPIQALQSIRSIQQSPQQQSQTEKILSANGLIQSPSAMLNPKTALTSGGFGDKVNPVKLTNKILSKLF